MTLGDSQKSILEHVYERLSLAHHIDKVVFAIPDSSLNNPLAEFLTTKGLEYYRGSEDDVLDRYYQCAKLYSPTVVVRATCDNPLVDFSLADDLIDSLKDYDYISPIGIPLGTGVEVFTMQALAQAWQEATTQPDHEHVTPYIYRNPDKFKTFKKNYSLPSYRLTVDEEADFNLADSIYRALYSGRPILNANVYDYLEHHQDIAHGNVSVHQKGWGE